MKIAQVFAHAVVRRIAYVLVAAVLAWCGIGRAHAADHANMPNEGAAYLACEANRSATQATVQQYTYGCLRDAGQHMYKCVVTNAGVNGICSKGVGGAYMYVWPVGTECPNGTANTSTGCAPSQAECRAKPALGNAFTLGGSGTTCKDGCQFAPAVSVCANGVCSVSGAQPTGQSCGVSDKPPVTDKSQECTPSVDGQTFCMKPDGQHCHTASAGRQICWQPGETGVKTDQDTLQKRDAGTEPVPPNVNLPNGDTLTEKGPPVQSNTQVKDGNGTRNITTVVQNYGTSNGTNAGSGNQGQNGNGTGGTGSGPGEGEGDGNEPGSPGDGVGNGLYEGSGKTVDSVMTSFMQQAKQSQMIGAAAAFMGNCSFGGGCPVWSYNGGEMMGNLSFELCNPALADLFVFAGALVMAVAAFCAFRIALY